MKVNDMKTIRRGSFKQNSVAATILLGMASLLTTSVAYANAGFGINTNIAGVDIAVPTYYAGSPQGIQVALDPVTHMPVLDAAGNPQTVAGVLAEINTATNLPYTVAQALADRKLVDTGTAMRKFVKKLPGAYNGLDGDGIPVGIAEKWVDGNGVTTGDDYYEYAIIEYELQMHPDLPKKTRLRGYAQIETDNIRNKNLKDITGLVGSEHIAATYLDGTPILKWEKDATGKWVKTNKQVYLVHKPNYLGPAIVAFSGQPVRMKATNYLPYTDADGVNYGPTTYDAAGRSISGEMPLPVDELIAGGGPVVNGDGSPKLDNSGHPIMFSQNRTAVHWHGGDAPWISDGTPHQWFAPAGDVSYSVKDETHPNGMGKGDSVADVPDMPESGPGSYTLFYPNNLSGRLMMYHDHVSGLTKLNAYIGEAAGYIVVDPTELTLAAGALGTTLTKTLDDPTSAFNGLPIGLLDSVGIPLVIQDKGFVPKNIGPNPTVFDANGVAQPIQSQDAKWSLEHWGQPGDLFFPHVYETNQDPNSADGTNPVGRWDWGPWFWPVFPSQYSLPSGDYGHATATPEAFMDTPTVNGQAYPTMSVDPKTYRFRILSIGNDRTQNLGLYVAVDANGNVCDAANTNPAIATVAPGQDPVSNPLAACTEVKMVPATQTDGFPANWPTDGRAGGVPDPATAGPDIVQIGNEGGLLPAPAVWKAQPVTFDQNVRSITILNVLNHQLLLGGGERADVLIDFSAYAGKTLILYNDAPAPMPGFDPRIDYYTGKGDQTDAGGSYDTLPGYGPNTRTVMQIKVSNATPAAALNVAKLNADLPVAYAKTQPAPIIPEVVYNLPFGTKDTNNYAQIFTGANTQPYFMMAGAGAFGVTGLSMTSGGSGYTDAATVTFSAPQTAGATATATPVVVNGVITGIKGFNPGSGYTNTSPIRATFSAPGAGGARATATVTSNGYKVINKAIQELFEPLYGRMNATLAVELPFTSQTIATTIPLAYIDAPVDSLDVIADGETQIWKITHNGVDTHPVHFHLVNVQVINRVDWAGTVKPPEANEVGWKETLRMNPLEDVYVAVKAKRPVAPFGLPQSNRVLDPSQAKDSQLGFTQINPETGQAPATPYSNVSANFDNEYVWHCHILGHEENDFMRPFVFRPTVTVPDMPANVAVDNAGKVTWTDTTPVEYIAASFGGLIDTLTRNGVDVDGVPTAGYLAGKGAQKLTVEPTNNPKNEIGFKVVRTVKTDVTTSTPNVDPLIAPTVVTVTTNGATTLAGTVAANTTSLTDAAYVAPVVNSSTDANNVTTTTTIWRSYSVIAYNVAGDSNPANANANGQTTPVAAVTPTTGAPDAPTGFKQTFDKNCTLNGIKGCTVLSWNAVAGASGYEVTIGNDTQTVTTNSLTISGITGANITVKSVGAVGNSAVATYSATATLFNGNAYAPVAMVASHGRVNGNPPGSVTLTWANNPLNLNNVKDLTLSWSLRGSSVINSKTFAATDTGATIVNLSRDKDYSFTLVANSDLVNTSNSSPVTVTGLSAP